MFLYRDTRCAISIHCNQDSSDITHGVLLIITVQIGISSCVDRTAPLLLHVDLVNARVTPETTH